MDWRGGQRCHQCHQTSPQPFAEREVTTGAITAQQSLSLSHLPSHGELVSTWLSPVPGHWGCVPRDVTCSPTEGPDLSPALCLQVPVGQPNPWVGSGGDRAGTSVTSTPSSPAEHVAGLGRSQRCPPARQERFGVQAVLGTPSQPPQPQGGTEGAGTSARGAPDGNLGGAAGLGHGGHGDGEGSRSLPAPQLPADQSSTHLCPARTCH